MTERELFQKYVKTGDVVYDIGANIGITVRDFLSLGAKHVYAFEPSPNNFHDLQKNCENEPVTCLQIALHEKEYSCVTPFKDCRTDYTDSSGLKMDTEQLIHYKTLQSVITELGMTLPDIIKLDIEGMESLVLKTFDFLFQSKRPVMLVEIHAKRRGDELQDYPDNPHFRWSDEGGFDFNLLKGFNYSVEYGDGSRASKDSDWNPYPGQHSSIVLIPNEQ